MSSDQKSENVVLETREIRKAFGGTIALSDGSFCLREGEIHALVGANGAGKSTLIKIVSGALAPDSGQVFMRGEETQVRSPHLARDLGIAAVYQEFSLVNSLSVAENIFLGRLSETGGRMMDWKQINGAAEERLKKLGTHINPKTKVKRLSVAQRQMVEITKALSNDPAVLIMDEPTSSLTTNDVDRLFGVLRQLSQERISILYVSHRLEELPMIAQRVTVYRNGRHVATLPIDRASKATIVNHMVGTALEHEAKKTRASSRAVLSVRNFSDSNRFFDIDFDLHAGEILGLAGLAGAGRTELVRAIFGADPHSDGTVMIENSTVEIRSPREAIRKGVALITEDRKEQGLVLSHSIQANVVLTVLKRMLSRFPFLLSKQKERTTVSRLIDQLGVVCSGPSQKARELSGGNQQKVVVAKWLATEPRVLIMDEPTRGIDVGAKGQMYSLLNELADKGIAILMVSSEIPEILEMSDRVIVMSQGRITAEEPVQNLTEDAIMSLATKNVAV